MIPLFIIKEDILLEKIFSIILCVISGIVIYSANRFDMSYIGDSGLGPDFFPKVIAVILIILSVLLFLSKDKTKQENHNIKYTMMVIIIFAIYIFMIGKLGYLVSTILFSFTIISILKKNSIILKIIYSLIFPIGLYLLFTYIFKVSLPTGIFI